MRQRVSTDSSQLEALLDTVFSGFGYDLRDYSLPLLRRRVAAWQEEEHVDSIAELTYRVRMDRACLERLLQHCAMRPSEWLGYQDFARDFHAEAVPMLRTYPSIRIWLPSCGTGLGAYAVAGLLAEAGLSDRSTLYATDISALALQRARDGRYPVGWLSAARDQAAADGGIAHEDRDVFPATSYRREGDTAVFDEALRDRIVFAEHSLATDGPFNEFHAVVACNVLMYFKPVLQARALGLFRDSLVKLGYLCLGSEEGFVREPDPGTFAPIAEDARLFRRLR